MNSQTIILFIAFLFTPFGYDYSNKGFRTKTDDIGTTFIVDRKFWEGCETGTDECQTLIFNRESLLRNVFLVTPCGGTSTSVSLYSADEIIFKDSPIMKISVSTEDCPPKLTLTGLPDGEYVVNMSACHLGGGIKFSLVTVL